MHTGIVLKNYLPKKYMLSVLDPQLGRIEAVVSQWRLLDRIAHGARIQYQPVQKGSLYRLDGFEIIDAPFFWARTDLLFFHHMLELVYFFVPLHITVTAVFNLLVKIYTLEELSDNIKRFIICHFFCLLGLYPENAPRYFPALFSLISSSSEIILSEVEKLDKQELNNWIKACIQLHPYAHRLKTLNFLT
jgi:hypothetical protein